MPHSRQHPRAVPLDFHEQPFVRSYVEEQPLGSGKLVRVEVRGSNGLLVAVKTPLPRSCCTKGLDEGDGED